MLLSAGAGVNLFDVVKFGLVELWRDSIPGQRLSVHSDDLGADRERVRVDIHDLDLKALPTLFAFLLWGREIRTGSAPLMSAPFRLVAGCLLTLVLLNVERFCFWILHIKRD